MKDYSQSGEQKIILDYFGDHVGTFLDIGAADGETFSNTRALALNGWSGTLVEPCARSFAKLVELYWDNDNVELVNALVAPLGHTKPTADFYYSRTGNTSTCNTRCNDFEKFQRDYPSEYKKVSVARIEPREASLMWGECDFISIDAELWSSGILHSMCQFSFSPKLICAEVGDFDQFFSMVKYNKIATTANNTIWERV